MQQVAQAIGWVVLTVLGIAAVRRAVLMLLWQLTAAPDGKVVVITGCDTGFGRMLSEKLAAKGYVMACCCLTDGGVEAMRKVFVEAGVEGHAFRCDVRSDADVAAFATAVRGVLDGRPVHAVVNNAGINRGMVVDTTSLDDINMIMDVNYTGTVRVSKAFIPDLMASKGRLINVASAAGIATAPLMGPYCASKHAVTSLSTCLRLELAPFGVKVITVAPGFYATSIVTGSSSARVQHWKNADPAAKARWGQPFFEHVQKRSAVVNSSARDPNEVVAVMEHAIAARFPCTTYRVGYDAQLALVVSVLPTFITDFLVGLFVLGGAPLPKSG